MALRIICDREEEIDAFIPQILYIRRNIERAKSKGFVASFTVMNGKWTFPKLLIRL